MSPLSLHSLRLSFGSLFQGTASEPLSSRSFFALRFWQAQLSHLHHLGVGLIVFTVGQDLLAVVAVA